MGARFQVLKPIVLSMMTFIAAAAVANTDIYFQNRTEHPVSLEFQLSGSKLKSDAYKIIRQEIAPGAKEKVFAVNRDSGIKNGKSYLIQAFIKIGEEKKNLGMSFYQILKGRTIGSYINHGMVVGDKVQEWSEENTGKYLSRVTANSVFRLHVFEEGRGVHDDLYYTLDEGGVISRTDDEQLKVLAYNIYMRPSLLFKNGQIERAHLLPDALKGRDILAFEEAFDNDIRGILKMGLQREYAYQTAVVGRDRGFEQDGGVFIASRFPILEEDEFLFGKICARMLEDCLADKGIKYAKVWNGKNIIHVFASHMQNGDNAEDKTVRRRQVDKLGEFIKKKTNGNKNELVLVLGDFNIDLRKEPDAFSRIGLQTIVSEERPFSFDPDFNELSEPGEACQIDFIFYAQENLIPSNFVMKVIPLKSKHRWKLLEDLKIFRDLSDHFPVQADISL